LLTILPVCCARRFQGLCELCNLEAANLNAAPLKGQGCQRTCDQGTGKRGKYIGLRLA
jgi:hypothetical protein